jgi:hypothetical protein
VLVRQAKKRKAEEDVRKEKKKADLAATRRGTSASGPATSCTATVSGDVPSPDLPGPHRPDSLLSNV